MPSQSFSGIFPLYKYRGETLAVLLDRFRSEHSLDHTAKLTYAGRLDPMAEGLVLVLAGEDRFRKDMLLDLPKTYRVEVLLGIGTDTLDPLGRITTMSPREVSSADIEGAVSRMTAITTLPYPMYSSVPVDGKPLFVHARAGESVEVPLKNVSIYSVHIESIRTESMSTLATSVVRDIERVVGDFRQAEIIEDWTKLVSSTDTGVIVTLSISCSSGTYMRSLAQWLGQELGVPAIAYSIERTSLGKYSLPK